MILTGDDGGDDSDEISVMCNYCIDNEVNIKDILLDKKGYTTQKTVENIKPIVDDNKVILITQKYHLNRALFISKKHKINAIGAYPNQKRTKPKYLIREYLSIIKAFFKTII